MNNKENVYIVECTEDRVRLLYSNKDHKEYKAFNIIPKENKDINHAIVFSRNDDKRLYCSSDDGKIFIFKFEDQALLKSIENTGNYLVRLSTSKILSYKFKEDDNKFIIIDIDTNSIREIITLEKKDYFIYAINEIMINSNNIYLSLMTKSNGLSFVKLY